MLMLYEMLDMLSVLDIYCVSTALLKNGDGATRLCA